MYGGTKTEMERLIKDANKVKKANGEMANLSIESFADMVEAIHIIQDEMGITGTTAAEAEFTITGSINSMKAAWHNLMTGIADENADFDKLMDDFVGTIVGDENGKGGVLDNLLSRIDVAADGVMKLIDALLPKVIAGIPGLIEKYVPQLATSAMSVVETLIGSLSDEQNKNKLSKVLGTAIKDIILHAAKNTPELVGGVVSLVLALVEELGNNLGDIIPAVTTSTTNLFGELAKKAPEMVDAVFGVINGIIDAVTSPEHATEMAAAGLNLLISIIGGMIASAPKVATNVITLLNTIFSNIGNADFNSLGGTFVSLLSGGISSNSGQIKDACDELVETAKGFWEDSKDVFKDIGGIFADAWNEGFADKWESTKATFETFWGKIKNFFVGKDAEKRWFGSDFMSKMGSGIQSGWSYVSSAFNTVWAGIKKVFSGWNIKGLGKDFLNLLKQGFNENFSGFVEWIKAAFKNVISAIFNGGSYKQPSDPFANTPLSPNTNTIYDPFANTPLGRSVSTVSANTNSIGSVNININGYDYENGESIAAATASEIQYIMERKSAVYV